MEENIPLKEEEIVNLQEIPVRMKPFPKAEKLILHRANLTKSLIDALVRYCELSKAKTFLRVEYACKEALSKYIYISTGKRETIAIDSKELVDRFDFFVDQAAKELDVYPEVVKGPIVRRLENEKKPNPVNFLYYTYLLMPNLDPKYFTANMNNIRTSVNVLWDRLSGTKHSSLQSMLYLYSTEGGVGKSVFQNVIAEWARKRKVKIAFTRVPFNQFIGDEFNKNAICLFSDITRDECSNWNRLNDLIDGSNYVVEQKGKDRYELKAQAFLIGSSNFHPQDENNRRISHSFVQYGSTKLEPITQHTAFKIKDSSVDIDYYVDIVDKWICSCPDNGFDFGKYPTQITSSAGDWYDGIDDDYAFVLRAIADFLNPYDLTDGLRYSPDVPTGVVSVATLTNKINKAAADDKLESISKDYKFTKKKINHILSHLYKMKKITIEGDAKGTYEKKYNIKNLIDNADAIKEEQIVTGYQDFKDIEYDYIKEGKVVADVMDKIIKDKPVHIAPEALNFMKKVNGK